jgi:hypothetical protein
MNSIINYHQLLKMFITMSVVDSLGTPKTYLINNHGLPLLNKVNKQHLPRAI